VQRLQVNAAKPCFTRCSARLDGALLGVLNTEEAIFRKAAAFSSKVAQDAQLVAVPRNIHHVPFSALPHGMPEQSLKSNQIVTLSYWKRPK